MARSPRSVAERIRETCKLTRYAPEIRLQTLSPGVDNIRHDVRFSPRLIAFTGPYVQLLILRYAPAARRFLDEAVNAPTATERGEFKKLVQDLLVGALSQARAQQNMEVDLLANLALFKYLAWEVQRQYGALLLMGKNKLKLYEGPRATSPRGFEMQQILGEFQTQKKIYLRQTATELQRAVNEVQADAVRKTRESFFGLEAASLFSYFANPLLFADNGRDDFIHLEKYVMLGNFQRDPDRFEAVEEWLAGALKSMEAGSPELRELAGFQERQARLASEMEGLRQNYVPPPKPQKSGGLGLGRLFGGSQASAPTAISAKELSERVATLVQDMLETSESLRIIQSNYETAVSEILNVPENFEELFGAARTEQQVQDLKKKNGAAAELAALEEKADLQRSLFEDLYRSAEKLGILPHIFASYETARIYSDLCPPINPQNLKQALLQADERKKVIDLIRHYHLPESRVSAVEEAAGRVRSASPRDLRQALMRFVVDYSRHHRDTRNLAATLALMDRINLVMDERTEQLSRINGSLYEFLISTEEQPVERRVVGHVILKADIRDSTRLTSELVSRGLNPATYFSLNFYEPLNRILPRYGAQKVFIEGDAVILALFEKEGGGHAVALTCGLAREMTQIVRLYNSKSESAGLPKLEIGIGITFRNQAPLYLLDGENRIMISEALNLSDRLSGCHKLARKSLPNNTSMFNVYILQTISEETAAGAMEEFLVRYNVNGICLSEDAFEKLRSEISLTTLEMELPTLWGNERVTLHCGSVPLSADVYQRLVIRESVVNFVDPHTFKFKEKTQRRYFEICTSKVVYEYTEKLLAVTFGTVSS